MRLLIDYTPEEDQVITVDNNYLTTPLLIITTVCSVVGVITLILIIPVLAIKIHHSLHIKLQK